MRALRFASFVALALVVTPSLGCGTVLGLAIGASIPKRGDETKLDIRATPRGSDVKVVYYRPVDERGGGLLELDGTYRGTEEDRAIIERGDKAYLVPVSRIQEARVRPVVSNYATEGTLIGLGIDVTILIGTLWLAGAFREQSGENL
jgi:hypothetical protein